MELPLCAAPGAQWDGTPPVPRAQQGGVCPGAVWGLLWPPPLPILAAAQGSSPWALFPAFQSGLGWPRDPSAPRGEPRQLLDAGRGSRARQAELHVSTHTSKQHLESCSGKVNRFLFTGCVVWFLQRFDDAHKLLFKPENVKSSRRRQLLPLIISFLRNLLFYFQLEVPFAGNRNT